MRHIVLFDLDGTLTPARGSMTKENVSSLLDDLLVPGKTRVGILTGSGLDYVKQQVPDGLFEEGLEVFPCNGTQHWIRDWQKCWRRMDPLYSMREEIGADTYRRMVFDLLALQRNFMQQHPLQVTGNFISYRESMLNWCPVGRESGSEEREAFRQFDIRTGWRQEALAQLRQLFTSYGKEIDVKLGGDTSFDIFPEGWNKTFVMHRLRGHTVWFVGDRCRGDGNDREIYELLAADGTAFEVSHHDETPSVIRQIRDSIDKSA